MSLVDARKLTRTAFRQWQVTKYVQRGGWSNRDLLRLAHPDTKFIRVAAQRQATAQAAGEQPSNIKSQIPVLHQTRCVSS